MRIRRHVILGVILTFILALSATTLNADLGMVAGSLNFNVSVGGHQTLQFRAFNSGDYPISFNVIPPTYTQIPNQTTPKVVISPINGSIAPHSQLAFNVTVYMPSNDKPGDFWDNIAQVVAIANSTNPSGATVLAGVGKEISITSAPAKTDYALIYGGIAAVVVVVAGAAYYLMRMRKKVPAAKVKAAGKAKAAAARPSTRKKATKRKTVAKKGTARAKRGKGTPRRRRR